MKTHGNFRVTTIFIETIRRHINATKVVEQTIKIFEGEPAARERDNLEIKKTKMETAMSILGKAKGHT